MELKYFPGCKIKGRYPKFSRKLSAYLQDRFNIAPEGCCKEDFIKIKNSDCSALLICNNCAVELSKLIPNIHISYVYDLINKDEGFPFPDYSGKEVNLQLCNHGYENIDIQSVTEELLNKMNINYNLFSDYPDKNLNITDHMIIAENNMKKSDIPVITICPICNLAGLNIGKDIKMLGEYLFSTDE